MPDFDALPPIDGVLLSHDHYDHLDRPTVRALHRRFGNDLTWFTPLGYRGWFRRLGIERVVEADWWEEFDAPGGDFTVTAAPTRHWSRRMPWDTNARLWCSWAIRPKSGPAPRVYFGGDSGYASCFTEIGERLGPFDVSLIPIGAYDPRWFMSAAHVNPEEAGCGSTRTSVRPARSCPHTGARSGLTFEDPLEPPERLRKAWADAELPWDDLAVLRHGETLIRSRG